MSAESRCGLPLAPVGHLGSWTSYQPDHRGRGLEGRHVMVTRSPDQRAACSGELDSDSKYLPEIERRVGTDGYQLLQFASGRKTFDGFDKATAWSVPAPRGSVNLHSEVMQ